MDQKHYVKGNAENKNYTYFRNDKPCNDDKGKKTETAEL